MIIKSKNKPFNGKKHKDGSVDAQAYISSLLKGKHLTLPRFIKSIREAEEMTLEDFATLLGTTKQNLHTFEKGLRMISVTKAIEWAKKLGYPQQQFVQLAFQDILEKEGMKKYIVTVSKAA